MTGKNTTKEKERIEPEAPLIKARDLQSIILDIEEQLVHEGTTEKKKFRLLEKKANSFAKLGTLRALGAISELEMLEGYDSAIALYRKAISLYKMLGYWYKIANLAEQLVELQNDGKITIPDDIKWELVSAIEEARILAKEMHEYENEERFSNLLLALEKL